MRHFLCAATAAVAACFLVRPCQSYPSGAPEGTCGTMLPKHNGAVPRTSDLPYVISASFANGEGVKVEITANNGEAFRGFLIQAFAENGDVIPGGTYSHGTDDAHILNCKTGNKALTQSSKDDKKKIVATWIPPPNVSDRVQFKATIVKNFAAFWKDVTSPSVELPAGYEASLSVTRTTPSLSTSDPGQTPGQGERYEECGSSKGCFGFPAGCVSKKNCNIFLSFVAKEGFINFHLSSVPTGSSTGYGAVALSDDAKMGDDFVMECVVREGRPPAVEQSWNVGRSNEPIPSFVGMSNASVSFVDGRIVCDWNQQNNFKVRNRDFDLRNTKYHLLLARGSMTNTKTIHTDRIPSGSPMSLTSFAIGGGSSRALLVKVHGSLMVVSWISFASIGIMLARYFKQVWESRLLCATKVWFACHRGLMYLGVGMTVGAFVIIFVYAGGWSQDNPAHPILGVVTTVFAVIQPIMAFFRPNPGTPNRPLFNWLHWAFGNTAHICGIVTTFLAIEMKGASLPTGFLWILVGFVCFHILVHILMQIHSAMMDKKKNDDIPMKAFPTRAANGAMPPDAKKDAPGSGFRRFMLGIYMAVNISLVAALVLIICLD